jgi:hypothetical protein
MVRLGRPQPQLWLLSGACNMNRPNSHILRKRVDHGHDFDGEHRTQYHEPEKNKEEIDPCDVCSKCECEEGTSSGEIK